MTTYIIGDWTDYGIQLAIQLDLNRDIPDIRLKDHFSFFRSMKKYLAKNNLLTKEEAHFSTWISAGDLIPDTEAALAFIAKDKDIAQRYPEKQESPYRSEPLAILEYDEDIFARAQDRREEIFEDRMMEIFEKEIFEKEISTHWNLSPPAEIEAIYDELLPTSNIRLKRFR